MANARKPRDANPQDWLYLDPNGPSPAGLVFGVLRQLASGRHLR